MKQEAYWPRRIKYYLVGYPPGQVWWRGTQGKVPPTRSDGGATRGGVPPSGYPWPGLMGRGVPEVGYPHQGTPPPTWTWLGYPPDLAGIPPHLDLARVPPHLDLARVNPPPGPGWVPPPGVDRQMDRHESKHNLPVVLRTRSVMKNKWKCRMKNQHEPTPVHNERLTRSICC